MQQLLENNGFSLFRRLYSIFTSLREVKATESIYNTNLTKLLSNRKASIQLNHFAIHQKWFDGVKYFQIYCWQV